MSIQSNINATIASFAGIKKAHDLEKSKLAKQNLEQQKLQIKQQRLDVQLYKEKTKRKQVNLEVRKQRYEEKENGREQK